MSKVLGRAAKKYASRYLQLKVGHGAVGNYLARIGVYRNPPSVGGVVKQNSRLSTYTPSPENGEKNGENTLEISTKKEFAGKLGLREKG